MYITTVDQANAFLASAGLGYLSEKELEHFPVKLHTPIFQVPGEISGFTNRDEIISQITKHSIMGKVVFIYGSAGVGKTALAIKLGHLLKERFTDGVLWYKVEEDNLMDILLSIGRLFGGDVSEFVDKHVRATAIRSLLSGKNVLLILDSAELNEDIELLIPNSPYCSTIITSKKNYLDVSVPGIEVPLSPFTDQEVLKLFKNVLKEKYPSKHRDLLLKIGKRVGNSPLALHLIAKQLLHSEKYLANLPSLLEQESSFFKDLYDEDNNLYAAIDLSYKNLDVKTKTVLKHRVSGRDPRL